MTVSDLYDRGVRDQEDPVVADGRLMSIWRLRFDDHGQRQHGQFGAILCALS